MGENTGMKTRNTCQKMKILECLSCTKEHPTAETVYEVVKKDIPTISLGTVYRNLNFMAESGEILRLEIGGEYHFDRDTCFHQHCVCRRCGRITDVFDEEMSKEALEKARKKGFDAKCVRIIFYGICKDCKRGGKNGKN